jgi:uncharacterized protein YdeI (YjbR/CyaY-like superfamily)
VSDSPGPQPHPPSDAPADAFRGRSVVHPESREAWRAWLAEHHATSRGVWLAKWPRETGHPALDYEAIVEEALCFGWIDGQIVKLPDGRPAHLVTPRSRRSGWSRSNRDRVERLVADGRMSAAGLAAVADARTRGTWTMQEAAEHLEEPTALGRALEASPRARAGWDAYPPSLRRGLIWWVISAKRDATRERRVATIIGLAEKGERPAF